MEVMDIADKEEGNVWYWESTPSKGLMLTVIRTTLQAKAVRFLHLAFDTTGDIFLAGDQHGNIYAFDMNKNRFHLVQKTGQACTALAFNPQRTSEFLVALPDNSIKCFDKDSKQLVSCMKSHEGAVSSISVHSSGQYAISTSLDAAQLWDLDTFVRIRKLTTRKSVGIQKVFFLPFSNTMLSCFTDGSMFSWETDGLVYKHQLPVPDSGPMISYRAFAVTQDGKWLVAGGRSNLLHLWCLESNRLIRVIQMPPHVRAVKQLEFLPDIFDGGANQVLGVLSQDGLMRFVNINTHKQLFCLGSRDNSISTAAVSSNGRYIVAIMNNGSINIYCTRSLIRELNQAPPPQEVISGTEVDQKTSKASKVKARPAVHKRTVKGSARRSHKVLQPPARAAAEDKENELPAGLNKKRLLALLRSYGEYPAKYRMFVWRSLLRLPENHTAYISLTDKGVHAAYVKLQQKYPIKSQKLHRGLQRVLSALAHWAAIFGELEYLPLIVFPFVKLFQNNPLLCFEVVATVIVNWCQHWFEYFPNPPLNILSMVENVLAHHDRQLLRHLVDCGITSQLYVWPLLETFFSEVMTRDEWLRLFDSVFSNHPSFLLMACVAYLTCCREPLLLCSRKQDFEYFFHNRNNLDVGAMIKEAYRLMSSTPDDIHPRTLLSDFTPLTQGHYPVFNHYPQFLVEYHTQEKERIRVQEMEYFRERQELSALREDFVRRQAEEEAYHAQKVLLQKAEEQRRRLLSLEEEKLIQQRAKLAIMEREMRVQESMLDSTRKRFLKHRQDQQTKQIQTLDEEINRKMELREREISAAIQDLRVRRRDLEVQRTCLEQLAKQQPVEPGKQGVEVSKKREEQQKKSKSKLLLDTGSKKQGLEAGQLEFHWPRHAAPAPQVDKEEEEFRLNAKMRKPTGMKWDDVRSRRLSQEMWWLGSNTVEQTMEESQHLNIGLPHKPRVTFADRAERGCGSRLPPATEEAGTRVVCLNSSSPSENISLNLSLDRGRVHLDNSERVLLRKVQQLRQKLAARGREDSANYCPSAHMTSSTPH